MLLRARGPQAQRDSWSGIRQDEQGRQPGRGHGKGHSKWLFQCPAAS